MGHGDGQAPDLGRAQGRGWHCGGLPSGPRPRGHGRHMHARSSRGKCAGLRGLRAPRAVPGAVPGWDVRWAGPWHGTGVRKKRRARPPQAQARRFIETGIGGPACLMNKTLLGVKSKGLQPARGLGALLCCRYLGPL